MTTTNTTRAITATKTIEQLGGFRQDLSLSSHGVVSADELLRILGLFAKLNLDAPDDLTDTLENAARLAQRAHQLKVAAPTFDKDDLAADNYTDRFAAAMTGRLRAATKADALIDNAKSAALAEAVAAIRSDSPALIAVLSIAYKTQPTTELRDAHRTLLSWQAGKAVWQVENDYTAEWCLRWAWSQDAWNTLATETGAQMSVPSSERDPHAFALRCGGKPYLAPTVADAYDRGAAHHAAYRDWKADQNAEANHEWQREQFEQSVAQAEAGHRAAAAQQARREAALAAAEAAAD